MEGLSNESIVQLFNENSAKEYDELIREASGLIERNKRKMAATFVDVSSGRAVRVAAKESSKSLAREMHPEIPEKNRQQMLAYREMKVDDLFDMQSVKVDLPEEEFPGFKGERIVCSVCGEGINFRRQVLREGKILCRACAGESYYTLSTEE